MTGQKNTGIDCGGVGNEWPKNMAEIEIMYARHRQSGKKIVNLQNGLQKILGQGRVLVNFV